MIHSDNDFATVAYLRIKSATLQDKSENLDVDPSIPPVLEQHFEPIRTAVDRSLVSQTSPGSRPGYGPEDVILIGLRTCRSVTEWVSVSNIHAEIYRHNEPDSRSIEDKVHECFAGLQGTLIQRAIMTWTSYPPHRFQRVSANML